MTDTDVFTMKNNNAVDGHFPRDLQQINKGQLLSRIRSMRQQRKTLAPEEIMQMLNLAEIERSMEDVFLRSAQFWEAVRNVTVLLPLVFTWLSLGLAASAFAQTIDVSGSNKNFSLQSFLYLWAQGFPAVKETQLLFFKMTVVYLISGTPWHILSFSDLVAIDTILILGIILLTILFHLLEGRGQARIAALRVWIEQEIDTLCEQSQVRSLGPGAENKRPIWAVEVHTAIDELKSVLETVKSTMNLSTEAFTKTIEHFTESYQMQNQTVKELMGSVQQVEKSIDQLNIIYQQGKKIYEGLENVLPRMDTHFKVMAQTQEDTNTQLQMAASELTKSSKAINLLVIPFQDADLPNIARQSTRNMQQTNAKQEAILEKLGDIEARMNSSLSRAGMGSPEGIFRFLNFRWRRRDGKVDGSL